MTSSGRWKLAIDSSPILTEVQNVSLKNLATAGMVLLLTITVSAILLERLGLLSTGTGKIGESSDD